jgi:hypothetical protein
VNVSKNRVEVILEDGTLIRHKVVGYQGRIEGTTKIQSCFTSRGELLPYPNRKHLFQYRIMIEGESLRRIAPADDFEILEAGVEIICSACNGSFQSRPGLADKPRGRCKCGGWICPTCLACEMNAEGFKGRRSPCLNQRKRFAARLAVEKKAARIHV